jgi:putative ABC transport system permease protein
MNPLYIISEAIQALRSNLLRSMLTVVGIVVGIFSVTIMLALGAGLSSNILDTFDSFIAGDITIVGDLTPVDLSWVHEQRYVSSAVAIQEVSRTTVTAAGSTFSPTITLPLGDYVDVVGVTLLSGSLFDFSSSTYSERVALVNEAFVLAVQEETGVNVASTTVTIGGQLYTVLGVIEGGTGGFGRQGDGSILIPHRSAIGVLTNTTNFSSIAVNLKDQAYYEVAAKHTLESLNVSRAAAKDSEDYFSVTSAQDAIESAKETTSMLSVFLALIGSIALFVGGIGTMNMMLTTVTERTKEIGLRKAIGARDKDILLQILAESVMLTMVGGALGILLTYGASFIVNQLLAADSIISLKLSAQVVALATTVAFIVGVIFGVYPARNAAKLQPVEALRSE